MKKLNLCFEVACHVIPAGGIGECAMDENDRRLGSGMRGLLRFGTERSEGDGQDAEERQSLDQGIHGTSVDWVKLRRPGPA